MLSDLSIAELLGPEGPFADTLTGFAPRAEQQHLAEAVQLALENTESLVGEAGTGTGKTFAYLVPAIVSGHTVIISTGTRHLQDQLFHNDLPLVKRALASNVEVSLLKGRSNYLCRHRLLRALRQPGYHDETTRKQLHRIQEWSRITESGDIAEVLDVPEDSTVWGLVTSTDEFCSAHEYEELNDCFIHRARQRAQEAEIVVINHHLLCADLALKAEGFGELLPQADAFIIDEAHQLPEIGASFFGKRLGSRQLLDLCRDVTLEQAHEAPDMPDLRDLADSLESGLRHFRLAFGLEPAREAWHKVASEAAVERETEALHLALKALRDVLAEIEERGKGLESCSRRAGQQLEILESFIDVQESGKYIHWFETYRIGFSLNMTPIDVAAQFRQAMGALPASWVFTSATLAVGGDFSHFRKSMGIDQCQELQVDSPFNYRDNALLYLPQNLPEPQISGYTEQALAIIAPIIEACQGRTFLLFTSYRAMHIAEDWLTENRNFRLLVQGNKPKRELIEAFQSIERAVLLGTSSFWEGVDVRGEALSCVVIDKLPFSSPGDPVLSARIDTMKKAGGNPFYEYQLPQAAIALKQGIGRLIRDVTDKGVLVLCDPRIQTRNYGEIFIHSMPPMPITRDVEEVTRFAQTLFSEEPDQIRESGTSGDSVYRQQL